MGGGIQVHKESQKVATDIWPNQGLRPYNPVESNACAAYKVRERGWLFIVHAVFVLWKPRGWLPLSTREPAAAFFGKVLLSP